MGSDFKDSACFHNIYIEIPRPRVPTSPHIALKVLACGRREVDLTVNCIPSSHVVAYAMTEDVKWPKRRFAIEKNGWKYNNR